MLLAGVVQGIVSGFLVGRSQAKQGEEWFRLATSVSITSFLCFFGGFSAIGVAALANGSEPWYAFFSAVFGGAGLMATGVGIIWKRLAPKGSVWWVPQKLEEAIAETDGTLTEKTK